MKLCYTSGIMLTELHYVKEIAFCYNKRITFQNYATLH